MNAKDRYYSHKKSARQRKAEFELTFDEWYNWWASNGIDKNFPTANTKDQLCMCRKGDVGPYSLDNIYCATKKQNLADARKFKPWNKNSSYSKSGAIPAEPRSLGHSKGAKLVTPYGKFNTRQEAIDETGLNLSALRKNQINCPDEYYWEAI